jgi:hypothetical protein
VYTPLLVAAADGTVATAADGVVIAAGPDHEYVDTLAGPLDVSVSVVPALEQNGALLVTLVTVGPVNTLSVDTAAHPPGTVYETAAVPADNPVTTPVEGFTDIVELGLFHVPVVPVLENVIVCPVHKVVVPPVLGAGSLHNVVMITFPFPLAPEYPWVCTIAVMRAVG